MKPTFARHYNFLVRPCSKVTSCWFLYRVCTGISGLHSHNLQDCGFCTVAVLLPNLLVLKTINCIYNHYFNTVCYSKLFMFELIVFSVPPQYFLCSCAFLQKYLPWKSSKYYIFRYYVCILSYPKCNALAPYCHIGPLLQYCILPTYISIGRIFQKKFKSLFMRFDFFTRFV